MKERKTLKVLLSFVAIMLIISTIGTNVSAAGRFSDVNPSHPYYQGVMWATGTAKIANGYADRGVFGIDDGCTRGHAMMFLWKLAGKPAPDMSVRMPFSDVRTDHPYYKAILWGSQSGVTKGYANGTFGLNKMCTRGQIVTFIWRYKGQPASGQNAYPFRDAPTPAYKKAIKWAAENKITKGYSDRMFHDTYTCTRGQIVTFLYRMTLYLGSGSKVSVPEHGTPKPTSRPTPSPMPTPTLSPEAIEELVRDLEEAEAVLQEAKQAAKAPNQKIKDGAFAFFEDQGADEALNVLKNSIRSSYTKRGDPKDATNLEHMRTGIEMLRECNEIRAENGLAPIKTSNVIMALAQLTANSCDHMLYHDTVSDKYSPSDILLFTTFNKESCDPYLSWFYEERNGVKSGSGETGHYKILMTPEWAESGAAYTDRKDNGTWNTYAQCFFRSKEDDTSITPSGDTLLTVEEFAERFNEYYNRVHAEADEANAAVSDAQNAYDKAEDAARKAGIIA